MDRLITQAVFVADDDEDDRFLLQLAFEQHSPECQLIFVEDGMALLETLEVTSVKPCLIILDLNMPRLNGFDALVALRANPSYEHTPVVILTTTDSADYIHQAEALGANDFITKPLNLKLLGQLVLQLRHHWHLDACL
ncbi:response regulator [Spirosoma harenae]